MALAILAGLAIWVWQRGFVFVEIVAFLIHFDGLGAGPVRVGRIMAAIAVVVIVTKLVKGWRPPALPLRQWAPIWMLTVWAVFSGLWSSETGTWFFTFGMFGLGIAYFCTTGLLVDSHRLVQQFMRAYWVGAVRLRSGCVGAVPGDPFGGVRLGSQLFRPAPGVDDPADRLLPAPRGDRAGQADLLRSPS